MVLLSKSFIIAGILAGLGIILVIGLSSGLAARPNNCKKSSTTNAPPTTSVTSVSQSVTTTRSTTSGYSIDPTITGIRTTPTPSAPQTGTTTTLKPAGDIRLPKYLKPSNYKLRISAFFNPNGETTPVTQRFEGAVDITFQVNETTRRVVIHSDYSLIFDSTPTLKVLNGGQVQIQSTSPLESQLYEIITNSDLSSNTDYLLSISYKGDFGPSTNLVGFYLSSYLEDGVTKRVAATKYEPTDARKAFPCFDEPGLKATYDITVEHPANSIALSNWPQIGTTTTLASGRLQSTFETTAAMSTYLAAWAILPNDFGFKEATSEKGKKIRVYARKNAVNSGQADFALDIAKKSLDYFENVYFGISEAVPPKIDHIGLPQFPSGAMEHWGLIGYRETSLLYSDSVNSISTKQSVAYTIAHEVAHFWFGNLVTCRWWDDLWLNEGMARFLQFKAIDHINKEWDVPNQFLTQYLIPVMYDDSFINTHPISVPVNTPDEINSVFDSITYDKGSSLLRMLESTVGEENFRVGLVNFLRDNAFDAANAEAFYNSLSLPSEMSGITVKQYMDNWLLQTNFPNIKIDLVDIDSARNRVTFMQERYLLTQPAGGSSPYNFEWKIYMKCRAGGTFNPNGNPQQHLQGGIREFNVYLGSKQTTYDLDRKYTWVYCNEEFRGYYLTQYSSKIFNAFGEALQINEKAFSSGERANIIHNAFSLAYSDSHSYEIPASIITYMESKERENVPWRAFTYHANKIATLLEHQSTFYDFSNFAVNFARSALNGIDIWSNDGEHSQRLLKIAMVDFLCRMQDYNCLKRSTEEFRRINTTYFINPSLTSLNPVSPSLRSSVYRYHLQNSENADDSFKVLDLYEYTDDAQERSIAVTAVNFGRLPWVLDYLLELLLTPSSAIKPQDFFTIIINISRNPSGRHLGWYFFRQFWYDIVAKFGLGSRTLGNAVKSVCETFENTFLDQEMYDFFFYTEAGAGATARLQAVEIVKHNIRWLANNKEDIKENFIGPQK